MPLIYIPEEAALFTNSSRKLPENQILNLCDTLEKKLSDKVQSNLAKFKLDVQNLKKAVETLKAEQAVLATKPIQQIYSGVKIML